MHGEDFFYQAIVYLLAAVIAVPLAKRLGLGSVLGYLIAGILIGPFVFGLVGKEGEDVMHFAEFGVVLMLFLIGLELRPALLWKMRKAIFGLGGSQVLLSAVLIGAIAIYFNFSFNQAVAIGLILALSSTAIVLQTLAEKNKLKTTEGQSSFSVLLFQDIAVIPILAILPLLATSTSTVPEVAHDTHSVSSLPGWQQLLLILGVVSLIIVGGRFLSRYIFRFVANTRQHEVFTATALLLIIGIAVAMNEVGLSPALGTFLAGVVLSDSEYRHELESNIEPFKGLLLGLFFIAVGAGIDFNLLFNNPGLVMKLLFGLILVKFVVLILLARVFRLKAGQGLFFSFALAQGGEFAFVLIAFSVQNQIFNPEVSGMLLITVALSMALTPLLLIFNEKLVQPLIQKRFNQKQQADIIDDGDTPVIIAGFGRFGLVIGRLLLSNGFKATILDNNPDNIETLRKFGLKVYYGDATRPELIESAGAQAAKLFVIALDDKQASLQLAAFLKENYPHLKLFIRAHDLPHAFELHKLGVDAIRVETFDASLELGVKVLSGLGFDKYQAFRAGRTFKYHNRKVINELYTHWFSDKNRYIQEVRKFSEQMGEIMKTEQEHSIHESDEAWDTTTLREEVRTTYQEAQTD